MPPKKNESKKIKMENPFENNWWKKKKNGTSWYIKDLIIFTWFQWHFRGHMSDFFHQQNLFSFFWFFIISFHRKTTGAPSGTRAARLVGVGSWFPKRREQPGHQQIARRKVPWQVGNYLEDHPKTWIRGKSLVGGLNQPLWKILISQIGSFSPNKGWT